MIATKQERMKELEIEGIPEIRTRHQVWQEE